MKYFVDTEFIEDGVTIDLVSIGVVAEDGREFYQCNRDAKLDHADEWVIFKVFPHLPIFHARESGWRWKEPDKEAGREWPSTQVAVSRYEIRDRLLKFVGDDPNIHFWSYFADYDWVAICQLFGRMLDLPKGWPMYCRDLKQLASMLGMKIHQENSSHNALDDARWIRQSFEKILIQVQSGSCTIVL